MTTLIEQAATLFNTEAKAEKVSAYLWALNIRDTCGRCGGSGHYSYCQMYGTTCFGCKGRGEVAAKLTKATFATAKAKVDAGELVVLRAKWRAQSEAKRAFAKIEPRIEAAYKKIGEDHNAEYRFVFGAANWDNENGCRKREFSVSISNAQEMNNSLRRAFWNMQRDVKSGSIDSVTAVAQAEEIVELLETLRAEWLRFRGE
jgi:DnaJ-class molecular chaperone